MHKVLESEFHKLPSSVIATFNAIVSSLEGKGSVYVSSIRSSHDGRPRTRENGPNHFDFKAIDFVVTPFNQPTFLDQDGKPRSPNYHWNPILKDHIANLFDQGLIRALVYIEPDHIHIDSNHPPGVKLYVGGKSCYNNSKGTPFIKTLTVR